MYKSAASFIIIASMLSLSAPAFSAGSMKPGLWEVTVQSDMMKNMPKMSPAQIEQMRKMGVDMAQLPTGAIVNKMCITKEMAARDELPQMKQAQTGCEFMNQKRSSTGITMDMICDGSAMKGKGTLKTVFAGDQGFNFSSEFKGTVNGVPVSERTESSGKWLGPDCGSVQPIQDPAAKK